MKKEQLRREKMAMNQKAREEKLNQLNKRSEEIKRELENLEGFNKSIEVKKLKIS
jgi:ATP-dependent Clp protease ATP-binding subunit ClpA